MILAMGPCEQCGQIIQATSKDDDRCDGELFLQVRPGTFKAMLVCKNAVSCRDYAASHDVAAKPSA